MQSDVGSVAESKETSSKNFSTNTEEVRVDEESKQTDNSDSCKKIPNSKKKKSKKNYKKKKMNSISVEELLTSNPRDGFNVSKERFEAEEVTP